MEFSKRMAVAIVCLAILLAGTAWWRTSILTKKQPNILFILVDTLRADHLSVFGYERDTSPNIDLFAQENLLFTQAMTPSTWTPVALASLLSGRYPSSHGMFPPNSREEATEQAARLNSDIDTIAELLKVQGYRTGAVQTNPWLQESFNYNQGFDIYRYHHRVRAETVHAEARKIIDDWVAEDSQQPFFLYLHYMDPHNPFNPPEPQRSRYQGGLKNRAYPQKQEQLMRLYDGEIRYLDQELGKFFEYLKKQKLYDDLVVVFIADHGEQFMEHGQQGHGHQLHVEELHVPLIIKGPGLHGKVTSTVSGLDIFPTMLEFADAPLPAAQQGFSLLNHLKLREQKPVFAELKRRQQQKAVITPKGQKLILKYAPSQEIDTHLVPEQTAEFYDREQDKLEKEPLPASMELLNHLRNELESIFNETIKRRVTSSSEELIIDDATIDELESLGYL